jgi:hypothetical protein
LFVVLLKPALVHFQIIDEFTILTIKFLKLVEHTVRVVPIVANEHGPYALLAILNVVTSLGIHTIWAEVILFIIYFGAGSKNTGF